MLGDDLFLSISSAETTMKTTIYSNISMNAWNLMQINASVIHILRSETMLFRACGMILLIHMKTNHRCDE